MERRRKERDAIAKKLEIAEDEEAIAEMNNKIKFLENARKQSVAVPKDNVNDKSNNANQNNANFSTSFLSSSSQKIDPKKSVANASTNNIMNKNAKNFANNPRMDLQRRPIQLDGYRQICFVGIPRFANPIP